MSAGDDTRAAFPYALLGWVLLKLCLLLVLLDATDTLVLYQNY